MKAIVWALALALMLSAAPMLNAWAQVADVKVSTIEWIWPDSLKHTYSNVRSLAVKDGIIFAKTTNDNSMLRSIDSGKIWSRLDERNGLPPAGLIWTIFATREGRLLVGAEDERTIFASDDNGETWRRVFAIKWARILEFLEAFDGTLYAGGDGLFRSINGGDVWEKVLDDSVVSPYIARMAETPSGVILLGIGSGDSNSQGIFRSTDRGMTWNLSNEGLTNKNILRGLAAYSFGFSKTVYASTYDGGVFRSDNDGETWQAETGLPIKYGGAAFISSTLGVFVGGTTLKSSRGLYRFVGGSWELVGLKDYAILSIAQLSEYQLLVGTWDGVFLITFDITPVSVVDGKGNTPSIFFLGQNFPNPFNPRTTIEFSIPKRSYVNLTIYNTLGQEMAVLVNEEKGVGSYRVVWNGSQCPSGVYLYRLDARSTFGSLTSERVVQTKKMLLVK